MLFSASSVVVFNKRGALWVLKLFYRLQCTTTNNIEYFDNFNSNIHIMNVHILSNKYIVINNEIDFSHL